MDERTPFGRHSVAFGPFTAPAAGRARDGGPGTLRRAIAAAGGAAAGASREIEGSALLAERNREAAARAFRCVAAQVAIVLAACLAMGFSAMLTWHQLAAYEAALKNCAGV